MKFDFSTAELDGPSFPSDHMWLNAKEISVSRGRFQSCLREIGKCSCEFEDEKKGIKIKNEDREKLHVHIASYNNFPPLLVWPLRLLALLVSGIPLVMVSSENVVARINRFGQIFLPSMCHGWQCGAARTSGSALHSTFQSDYDSLIEAVLRAALMDEDDTLEWV